MYLKFLVGFFIVCFTANLSGQSINQLDSNGKKTGVWKKFYENGSVRYEGQFENDKEVGTFKFYDEDSKTPTIIKVFEPKSTIAEVTYYQTNGLIESTGKMDGKLRISKWRYFYPNGKTLMIEENYINGILEGVFKSYFKNSKTSELLVYKNGKLHGNCKRFGDNGVLIEESNYENGQLNGAAAYYTTEGVLVAKGNYENDEKVGSWEYPIKLK